MGDAENALPPSKKRAAGRELSRDNPGLDDEEDTEQEIGTFKRASDEVLANRRIVKVRRNQTVPAPSSNPFSGIRLVPPDTAAAPTAATSTGEKVSEGGNNDACEDTEKGKDEEIKQQESKTDVEVAETSTGEKVSEGGKNDACEDTEKGKDEEIKQQESKTDVEVAETAAEESPDVKGKTDNEAAESKEYNEKTEDDKAGEESSGTKDDKSRGENVGTVDDKREDEKLVAKDVKTDSERAAAEDAITENLKADAADKESEEKNRGGGNANPNGEGTPLSSFQQLSSSKNAFTGLAGTGFSASTFTFGAVPKDGSALGTSPGSLFGQKSDQPSFGFGHSSNGSSLFNTTGSSTASISEQNSIPSMQEVPVETGEENERVVFSAESVLFEFLDGTWKERGKGEVKVNVSTSGTERARLLMRARGNYRLILNASLYPDMKLKNMDKKGITFACMNSIGEGKGSLSTFAVKFKDASLVDEFRAAVTAHKGKTNTVLKTPENSPKASDE